MPENFGRQRLHVVGQSEGPAFHHRMRLHRPVKRLRPSWTHAQRQPFVQFRVRSTIASM